MSLFYRLPLLGIALLTAVALTGCESKSKREFNAGCQSGATYNQSRLFNCDKQIRETLIKE